jgi:solute carrier family 25 S-adenosylmethionine transporter 26
VADYTERPVRPYESALCGSVSGAFAAAVTTPLDVVKTRLMLGSDVNGVPYKGMFNTMSRIYTTEGGKALFSGIGPRVMWIAIGGGVFFGMYEFSKSKLQPLLGMQDE